MIIDMYKSYRLSFSYAFFRLKYLYIIFLIINNDCIGRNIILYISGIDADTLAMYLAVRRYPFAIKTTYGELRTLYPQFTEIYDRVLLMIGTPCIDDNTISYYTELGAESVQIIDRSQTIAEIELQFEIMLYEFRELIMSYYEDMENFPLRIRLERSRYEAHVDSLLRPAIEKVVHEFFT